MKNIKNLVDWILVNNSRYNLASDICGENYNLNSQELKDKPHRPGSSKTKRKVVRLT